MSQPVPPPTLPRLPFSGRSQDLARLHAHLENARHGRGTTVFLSGEPGVGKSRLAGLVAEGARRDGWTVAEGRAYPVESGVPYALFSDAVVPVLREIGREKLALLTRGSADELEVLFPLLRAERPASAPTQRTPESTLQLHWIFAQLLKALAAGRPLLVVLDDLHWGDASSIELLHFVGRHLTASPLLVLATVNDAERSGNAALLPVEQSLQSIGVGIPLRLEPLGRADTAELVQKAFGAGEAVTREFTALLHGWTRGNPFFIDETLKALVESGRLRQEGGRWRGWEMEDLDLPATVRDAILLRLAPLERGPREVAEVVAVAGTRTRYATLRAVCSLEEGVLVDALEQLRHKRILAEAEGPDGPVYEMVHPLTGKILAGEVGLARRRLIHAGIARALEAAYGARVLDHADELAVHFVSGGIEDDGDAAVRYLAEAGRRALTRFASREAASYLAASLDRAERRGTGPVDPAERFALMADLARAHQRLGEYETSLALVRAARDDARARGDALGVARMERRIGLAHFWGGRHPEALAALDAAAASAAADPHLLGRIRMTRGVCHSMLGDGAAAEVELRAALGLAEGTGDPSLLARVHRALLLFHAWAGAPGPAWEHGETAIALAVRADNPALLCACHWAMAVVAGLTGRAAACEHHLREGTLVADALQSPLLRLAFDEIAAEYACSTGDWENGIALAERAIALARSLNQRTVLPRLLVFASLMYIGRHELDRAADHLREAWDLAGADLAERAMDMHSVIPVHTGMAAYHLARGDLDEAVRVAEAGLAIADRTGYTIWAVHRLIAVLCEAHLRRRDLPEARRVGDRLRTTARQMGHVLGMAWADANDAVLSWLEGDPATATALLRGAAEALEAVPFVPDAARIRRQLAGRLADVGDREGALRELRRVHDVFLALGAREELRLTRAQFHELESRPPARPSRPGAVGLTGREVEIVRLVALRKSNKAIAGALGISPRTVTTHLSNIYQKLEVSSRTALADLAGHLLADR